MTNALQEGSKFMLKFLTITYLTYAARNSSFRVGLIACSKWFSQTYFGGLMMKGNGVRLMQE